MKSIVMFVLGAALAAGIVVFVMKRDRVAEPVPVETAQSATAPAAQPAAQPPAQATMPEAPAASPAPDVQAASAAEAARNAPRSVRKPSTVPKRTEPKPTSTSVPAYQPEQPQQTAQSTPPPAPPAALPSPMPEVQQTPAVEERKPEPRQPKTVTIPGGTLITVRLDEALTSDKNQSGDSFRATLDSPVIVDGFVIAERGSRVEGRVAEVDRGGRVKGLSQMALELVRLNTADGQRVKLQTEPFTRQGEKSVGRDAAKIGAAAGIGAAIGAIAGGGKGAAIGAAVGGAAGTGGIMATRGAAAQLPAETRVSFRLSQPVTITEKI
jgi:hypothetical protein